MGFVRVMVIAVLVLAVVYWSAMNFLCARERERLHCEGARRTRLADGVEAYARKIRRPVALGTFGIPMSVLLLYILISNNA